MSLVCCIPVGCFLGSFYHCSAIKSQQYINNHLYLRLIITYICLLLWSLFHLMFMPNPRQNFQRHLHTSFTETPITTSHSSILPPCLSLANQFLLHFCSGHIFQKVTLLKGSLLPLSPSSVLPSPSISIHMCYFFSLKKVFLISLLFHWHSIYFTLCIIFFSKELPNCAISNSSPPALP